MAIFQVQCTLQVKHVNCKAYEYGNIPGAVYNINL